MTASRWPRKAVQTLVTYSLDIFLHSFSTEDFRLSMLLWWFLQALDSTCHQML